MGGGDKGSSSHAEVGTQKNVGVVLTWVLEVLGIPKGGTQSFHPVGIGAGVFKQSFRLAIFPFCSPPPPHN